MSATLSTAPRVLDVDLVLGTMYFGTRTDEATSFAMLDRYVEAGGRVLDTANCYSFWTVADGARRPERGGARPVAGGQPRAARGAGVATKVGVRSRSTAAESRGCRRRWSRARRPASRSGSGST